MKTLDVYLDGNPTPVQVTPIALYFWEYEQTGESAEYGLRLWCAFSDIEERSPKNIPELKEWARKRKVLVELGADVDPTLKEVGAGPRSA